MELLIEHLGKGLGNILLLSMPIVLTAAGIGLVVGILQAVTQVQEQTIAAAPKIVGVFLVIIMGGGFITDVLTTYLRDSMTLSLEVIPKEGIFAAVPNGDMDETEKFIDEEAQEQRQLDYTTENINVKKMLNSPVSSPFKESTPKGLVSTPSTLLPTASLNEHKTIRKNTQQKKSTRSGKSYIPSVKATTKLPELTIDLPPEVTKISRKKESPAVTVKIEPEKSSDKIFIADKVNRQHTVRVIDTTGTINRVPQNNKQDKNIIIEVGGT